MVPFYLYKRRNGVYYYKLKDGRTYHSTSQKNKRQAEAFVFNLLHNGNPKNVKLKEYARPFFKDGSCPHLRRLKGERKKLSQIHLKKKRAWMQHIFADKIAERKLSELKRADIIDFRARLTTKLNNKYNTINKVIETLKVVLNEALFREDINRDLCKGIGIIKYKKKEAGTFLKEELLKLFPEVIPGPWLDVFDYNCFLIAATTGMRRGEILALKWNHIDLENRIITVETVWKGMNEYGLPKSGKKRRTPVPTYTTRALKKLYEVAVYKRPDDYIFTAAENEHYKDTWWLKRFGWAMNKAGINRAERNLKPHSFRHTLNTYLRKQGFDPAKIRSFLGWSSERIQKDYTHFGIEDARQQAEIIDSIYLKAGE